MRNMIRDELALRPGRWCGEWVSYAPEAAARREHFGKLPAREAALEGLAGSSLADRFRAWRGASGQRYVFSVFASRPDPASEHLPLGGPAVVIVVTRREGEARSVLWIGDTGPDPARFFRSEIVQGWAAQGCCELHLFFRAGDAAARAAVVADLRAAA